MLNRIILTTSSLLILSACDSGSSSKSPSPDINTGRFVDSPVSGLQYKTETQSGLTNTDGEFTYLEGEMIEFSIGGIKIGTASAQELITPFTLSGSSPLINASEITETLKNTSITSFDRVINIATLLQALDTDANPDNGIDLGDANEVLAESSINFYAKATEFENQSSFSDILSELDIDSSRTFIQAAQHLYESLDVDIKSDLAASMLTSENGQDKALINYSYNQEQQVTEQRTDLNNNGSIDKVMTYAYDEHKRLIQTSDSSSNITETISYDLQNNILTKEIDTPTDENDIYQTYSYDDGLLIALETDLGADGLVDISTQYNYDANGNLSSYTTTRTGETESNATVSYTYTQNRIRSLTEDNNGDGEANSSITYNYDVNGNVLSKSTTRSLGGYTQTSINSFSYDANNNPIRYERDDNQDGEADYIESYQHNRQNKRTEYKKDSDADGTWDFVAQYNYDDKGNRIRMIEDSDGDGIVDKIWRAEYEAATLDNPWSVIEEQL